MNGAVTRHSLWWSSVEQVSNGEYKSFAYSMPRTRSCVWQPSYLGIFFCHLWLSYTRSPSVVSQWRGLSETVMTSGCSALLSQNSRATHQLDCLPTTSSFRALFVLSVDPLFWARWGKYWGPSLQWTAHTAVRHGRSCLRR